MATRELRKEVGVISCQLALLGGTLLKQQFDIETSHSHQQTSLSYFFNTTFNSIDTILDETGAENAKGRSGSAAHERGEKFVSQVFLFKITFKT